MRRLASRLRSDVSGLHPKVSQAATLATRCTPKRKWPSERSSRRPTRRAERVCAETGSPRVEARAWRWAGTQTAGDDLGGGAGDSALNGDDHRSLDLVVGSCAIEEAYLDRMLSATENSFGWRFGQMGRYDVMRAIAGGGA